MITITLSDEEAERLFPLLLSKFRNHLEWELYLTVLTDYITTKTGEGFEDFKDLIALVERMPDFELKRVVKVLATFTGSQDAAYVYLAAFALWTESVYRGSVLKEDISERLRMAKIPIPLSRIVDAIDLLTKKHLLTTHPERDVNFSKPGIRLGKKLASLNKNPVLQQRSENSLDESSIVISDSSVITATRNIIFPYIDSRSCAYYLPTPNALIPGLKIYERGGTMRVEFDARDDQRARAALVMRQEFLLLAGDIAKTPGLYREWETKYYGTGMSPAPNNNNPSDRKRGD